MTDWPVLIQTAVVYGLGLSVALTVLMVISGRVVPDMWVGDYPPDIREKYGPMSKRSARLRPVFAALLFGLIGVVAWRGLGAIDALMGPLSFGAAFASATLMLLVFNVFDLLVLDWLVFCTWQPRQIVLPGTEGMAGYRDYRFHFVGFLKGFGFCAAGGLLMAGLWTLLT